MQYTVFKSDAYQLFKLFVDSEQNIITEDDPEFESKLKGFMVVLNRVDKTLTIATPSEDEEKEGKKEEIVNENIDAVDYNILPTICENKIPLIYDNLDAPLYNVIEDIDRYFAPKEEDKKKETFFILKIVESEELGEILQNLINKVFIRFGSVEIHGFNRTVINLEDLNIQDLQNLYFEDLKIAITGTNILKCNNFNIVNCDVGSRFKKEESEIISQLSILNTGKANISGFNFVSDCRIVFSGIKNSKLQWTKNTIDINKVFVKCKDNQNSKINEYLLKIVDYYTANVITFHFHEMLDKLSLIRLDGISFLNIDSLYVTSNYKKNPEVVINNCSSIFISNCTYTNNETDKGYNNGFHLSKLGELGEVTIQGCTFKGTDPFKIVESDFDSFYFINNTINSCTDLFKVVGNVVINTVDYNDIKGICNKFEIDDSKTTINEFNIMNSTINVKNESSFSGSYIYIKNSDLKFNSLSISITKNISDENKQSLYIDDAVIKADSINFLSLTDNSKLSLSLVSIITKEYLDQDFTKVLFSASKIESNSINLNSFLYSMDEMSIPLKKLPANNGFNIRGKIKGLLNIELDGLTNNTTDINFEDTSELEKNYLDINFKGEQDKTYTLNFKFNNHLAFIIAESNDYTFNTKVNLFVKNANLIENGCYFLVKENNPIVLKMEEVIDSRIADCVYTNNGNLERMKYNYGIKK